MKRIRTMLKTPRFTGKSPGALHFQVVIIRKSIAGIGPDCRAFHWCREHYQRTPMSKEHMISFRKRLGDCLG